MNNSETKTSPYAGQFRYKYLSSLLVRLEEKKHKLLKLSNRYSYSRLSILLGGFTLSLILFFTSSNLAALISFAIFILTLAVTAHFHGKLDNGIKKLDVWIKIKETHIARLNLDWGNIPKINYVSGDKLNPIEKDLNLAGEGSLHQLINTGTSVQSMSLLRTWLNNKTPVPAEITERQSLVRELIPLVRFRDKLILNSFLFSIREFNGEKLLTILSKKDLLKKSFKLIFASLIILAPINILLFVLFLNGIIPAYWGITLLIYIALFHQGNKDKDKLVNEAVYLSDELGKLGVVFEFLEEYKYHKNSRLCKLCEPFLTFKERPSFLINKIKNSMDIMRIRKGNPFVWTLIRIVYPIDFYYNAKLVKYKNLVAGHIDTWLEAWYKLEAISSLANFAYLNPEYNFPKIIETENNNKIVLSGKNFGHPLIKKENKICNDFLFDPEGEIAIITGSNMSGKSTFVRTLGMNLSLAYAGSVVNAEQFEVSPLRIFTCINVSDSVIDGISYFYAEVKRLKSLLNEINASEIPVFFLIDEIFRGTNNIERLKGSSAFIKKLAQTNSIGAVATHDLELIKLSGQITKVRNFHFKEDITNGKMIFDYKLNEGPCPTTNALKIMKLEGLPVD